MISQTIAHYRIIQKLGAGGMAEKNPAGTAQIGFGVPNIDDFYSTKPAYGVEFT